MTTPITTSETDEPLAEAVDDAVDRHPWLEPLTRIGWLAKGVVYTLMGLTALQVARQDPVPQEASPQGSIGRIAEAPLGRVLLTVLAVGLVLYSLWRILSVGAIRGTGASEWGDRIGYTFSALFYLVLAYSAGRAAVTGVDPENSNSVERISRSVLEMTAGRWLLGVAGVVTIVIGAYFVVHKGVQRSFVDDLEGVGSSPSTNRPKRNALLAAGVAGWIGRGVVVCLVGFFVARASVRFDADDARGFDRTLRNVAGTGTGTTLVVVCALGLILYGVFCLLSYRLRTLADTEDPR